MKVQLPSSSARDDKYSTVQLYCPIRAKIIAGDMPIRCENFVKGDLDGVIFAYNCRMQLL